MAGKGSLGLHVAIFYTLSNTLPPRSEQSALVPALRAKLCLQPTYSRTTENRLLVDI